MEKALTNAQLLGCTLDPREWKAKLEPLESSGVHEEERVFGVSTIIDAHGFAFLAG